QKRSLSGGRSMRRVSILYALCALVSGVLVAADPPCPPPIVTPGARILYLGPASAGYSDELPVRARLVDENAAPMAARTLAFTFGGEPKTSNTGGADHPPLPVANRPIDFTLGTHVATGVTDANGVATVNLAIADAEVGGGVVVVRFAGDAFYRESQDSRATFAFQGSAFVVWGGN